MKASRVELAVNNILFQIILQHFIILKSLHKTILHQVLKFF